MDSSGLKEIIEIFKTNSNQVANILGITRQTFSEYLTGKRLIPEARLEQLSDHFGIQKSLFIKKLSEIEKIEVQKKFLMKCEDDFGFEHLYNELDERLKQERTISKVRNSIKTESFDDNDLASIDNYIINVILDKLNDEKKRKIIEFMVYNLDLENGFIPQFSGYERNTRAIELFREMQKEF